MRRENRYVQGDRWAICDVCNDKVRRSQLRRDGKRRLLVCETCHDAPNPAEYLKPPRPVQPAGDSRPPTYYNTTVYCSPGAIPDLAIPDCAIPDTIGF